MNRLRKQFLVVLLGVAFTVIAFSGIYLFSTNLLESRQEAILLLESEKATEEFNQYFYAVETILDNLTLYIHHNADESALLDYMVRIDSDHPMIASLYLGKPDLTMVNSTGFIPPPGFDLTTRLWYQDALNSDTIIYTNAFLNATEDRMIVTVAKAVYRDNNFIGVIAADIDILTLNELISTKTIGESGFAFLIDSNHHLLAAPSFETSPLALINAETMGYPIINHNGESFHYRISVREQTGVLVSSPIKDGTYTLNVFMDNNEYYQQTQVFLWVLITVGFFFVLSGSGLYAYYLRFVRRPIDALLEDIDTIDIGENTDYRLSLNPNKGFVGIRRTLNNVLSALALFQSKVQETNRKLLIENQRVIRLMESNADIVFEIDRNRRFVSVFGKGLKTINHNPEDFMDKTVLDVFGDDGIERDNHYQEALKGKTVRYEWQYLLEDNRVIYFSTIISAIRDQQKEIIGAVGITRDITEEKQKQQEIEHLSFHDYLTGLHNRRYFSEVLLRYDTSQYYPLALINIDVNGLKLLNDAFGHQTGDLALKKLAQTFSDVFSPHGAVCRIGGDEFAVLIPNTDEGFIETLKKNILDKVASLNIHSIQLSIALGYAIKESSHTSIQEMMNEAENKMYKQKILEGKSARSNAIQAILNTLTHKYALEERHSKRVANISKAIGKALMLKHDEINELVLAASVHDIGKIAIPDEILNKPSLLDKEEYEVIKAHTEAGYQILRAADEYSSLAEDALCHHEHYDGNGYPNQLKGEEIPLFSRIIGVADAYEAMTSDRPYRKALSKDKAIQELIKHRGTQFDPKIVDVFIHTVLKQADEEL